jgi:hypothetical protein
MSGGFPADGSGLAITAPGTISPGATLPDDGLLPIAVSGIDDDTPITVVITDQTNPVAITAEDGAALSTGAGGLSATISGTRDQVNATLATLLIPASNDTVTLSASDAAVATGETIAVAPVADGQPILAVPSQAVLPGDTIVALPAIQLSDPAYDDGNYLGNGLLTVTLTAASGVFLPADLTFAPAAVIGGIGTDVLTITGGANTVDAALARLCYVGDGASTDSVDIDVAANGVTLASGSLPLTLLAAPTASAFAWSGGSGADWPAAANWLAAGAAATAAPDGADPVTLPADSAETTIAGDGAAASLTVAGAYQLTGAVAVGGTLSVSGLLQLLGAGSTTLAELTSASATIAGGTAAAAEVDLTTAIWTNDGTLQVGDDAAGTAGAAVLDIRNGATLSTGALDIRPQGLVSVVSTGSLAVSGTLTVGDASGAESGGANGTMVAAGTLEADALVLEPGASVLTKGIDELNSLTVSSGALFGGVSKVATASGGAVAVTNDGTIDGPVGVLPLELTGAVSGSGTLVIDAGGGLQVDGPVAATQTVVFRPGAGPLPVGLDGSSGGLLIVQDVADFRATITGFAPGDVIYATSATTLASATIETGNVLALLDANGNTVETLQLDPSADYSGYAFSVSPATAETAGASEGGFAADQYAIEMAPADQTAPAITTSGGARVLSGLSGIVPLISIRAAPDANADATYTTTLTATTGAFSELLSFASIGNLATDEASGSASLAAGDGSLMGTDANGNPITILSIAGTGTQTLTISASSLLFLNLQTALVLYQATGATGATSITVATTASYAGQSQTATATVPITVTAAPASFTWLTGGSPDGTDPANWSSSDGSAGPPGAGDPTLFGPGSYPVTGDISTGDMTVTGYALLTGALYVAGSLNVSLGGGAVLAGALTATGNVVVGQTGPGSLNFSGLINLIDGNLVVGQGGAGYLQTDALVAVGGDFEVGDGASGAVDVGSNSGPDLISSGSLQTAEADIGVAAGDSGTVVAENASWDVDDTLTVGVAGDGTVQLIDPPGSSQGTYLTATDVVLGADPGSIGDLVLDNDAQVQVADTVTVGEEGDGTLTLAGTSEVEFDPPLNSDDQPLNTTELDIGAQAGSSGTVIVDGGFMNADVVSVGGTSQSAGGQGTLLVEGSLESVSDLSPPLVGGQLIVWSGGYVEGLSTTDAQINGGTFVVTPTNFTGTEMVGEAGFGNGITIAAAGTILGAGTLDLASYDALTAGAQQAIDNAGLIEAQGGELQLLQVANTGIVLAPAGTELDLAATDASYGAYEGLLLNGGTFGTTGGLAAIGGTLQTLGNSGTLMIGGGGTLQLGSGATNAISGIYDATYGSLGDAGQTVVFDGPGTLSLLASSYDGHAVYSYSDQFAPDIEGFASGDTIDLGGTASGVIGYDGGTLSLLQNTALGASDTLELAVGPGYSLARFAYVTTGADSSQLTLSAACYGIGTRIATPSGAVPIETLAVGGVVATHGGAARQIRWIGYRDIDCRRHPRPAEVWPIVVQAGAFGEGQPLTTLTLSPDHAVFAEGVLIPIRHLVNGATIRQEPCETVSYWHVELPAHDVILAEGLPCESYLDTGNRAAFANGGACIALHPAFAASASPAWAHTGCAPRVEDGPLIATVRSRLAGRAMAMAAAPCVPELLLDAPGEYSLHVPAEATAVRLVSPSRRPGSDRRRLGALIRALCIDGRDVALDDARLGLGFHEPERHGAAAVRWTDGAAMLRLDPADGCSVVPGERRLSIDVAAIVPKAREEPRGDAICRPRSASFTAY